VTYLRLYSRVQYGQSEGVVDMVIILLAALPCVAWANELSKTAVDLLFV